MRVELDISGLDTLTLTASKAASESVKDVRAVVAKGAANIRSDWRRRWSGLAHAPAIPYAISFDVYASPGAVNAQIGVDKERRQGPLANLLAYGSVNNAPVPGPAEALRAEEPKFTQALQDLAERPWR